MLKIIFKKNKKKMTILLIVHKGRKTEFINDSQLKFKPKNEKDKLYANYLGRIQKQLPISPKVKK